MKTHLLVLICIPFGACSTVIKGPNGKTRMRTYANARYMHYKDENCEMTIHGMNHSTPTRATGSVIGTTGSAGTSLVTAWLTRGVVR